MFESTKVAVLGAGLMGCGIAQVFACKQIAVTLYDPYATARDTAKDKIASNLEIMSLNTDALQYINVVGDLQQAVSDADFIIEAVPEKRELKQQLFSRIRPYTKSTAVVASNTSVIPIKEIFEGLHFENQVVGTHWWNPPYLVPLVEVVQTVQSSDEAIEKMMTLLKYVGKEPVHVKKDVPGFVGNRMQHALWREAIALINDGVCSAEGVDAVVKNSFGLRLPVLGPIENADLVGLDLTLDIHNVILESLNNDTQPADILKHKVDKKEWGMKTGKGFKTWTEEEAQAVKVNLSKYLIEVQKRKGHKDEKES